jgi:hypothetical protein
VNQRIAWRYYVVSHRSEIAQHSESAHRDVTHHCAAQCIAAAQRSGIATRRITVQPSGAAQCSAVQRSAAQCSAVNQRIASRCITLCHIAVK